MFHKNKFAVVDLCIASIAISYFLVKYYDLKFIFQPLTIIAVILLIAALQFIKMIRLYLIFLNNYIGLEMFSQTYALTTFINIILPHRLGEFYRIFSYGRVCGNFRTGFLGILIDRFFDSLVLIVLFFLMEGIYGNKLSSLSLLLIAFVILAVFIYVFYPQMYSIINRYLITNNPTKRSLAALRFLNLFNDWYVHIKRMLKGKFPLLMLCSIVSWLLEYIVLANIFTIYNQNLSFGMFINYLDDKSIYNNAIFNSYTAIHSIMMFIIAVTPVLLRKVKHS